jgi:hypothetical protein
MSFRDFQQSIVSPDLQTIAAHWDSARGGKRLPAWRDIDPVAIGRRLRYVWAWKYQREPENFVNRLAGEDIVNAFGKSPRGKMMTEFFAPDVCRTYFPWHVRVVREPAFMHGAGKVYSTLDRYFSGERIMLPLSEDGVDGDGILGATVYFTSAGAAAVAGLESEKVNFYPL